MMKAYNLFFIFTLCDRTAESARSVRGISDSNRLRELQSSMDITFTGICNFENVLKAYNSENVGNGKEILAYQLGLPGGSNDQLEAAVNSKCREANDANQKVEFSSASNRGYQFDKNFFDGGTKWNQEVNIGNEGNLAIDAGRIPLFYENVARRSQVSWPAHITNFDDTPSCSLRTVMCCWVSEREGKNGPVDNSDVCLVDLKKSPRSNHVASGFTVTRQDNMHQAHCNGFAWSSDTGHFTNRFKGNSLFYISMYKNFYQNSYVKNIPGGPMCGCIEQMPIVTHADCTETREGYKFSYDGTDLTTSLDIEFAPCSNGNDLSSYYDTLVDADGATSAEKEKLDTIIVGEGNCKAATDKFLIDKLLVRSATEAPTISPAPSITPAPTSLLGPEEKGYCVRSDGRDQNSGVIKLGSGNFDKDQCISLCIDYVIYTGCEVIHNQGNKGCYVHTDEVARGNSVGNHWCWIK